MVLNFDFRPTRHPAGGYSDFEFIVQNKLVAEDSENFLPLKTF